METGRLLALSAITMNCVEDLKDSTLGRKLKPFSHPVNEVFPHPCAYGVLEECQQIDCLVNMKIRDYFRGNFG